jgi:N-acetylneuraminate synthase
MFPHVEIGYSGHETGIQPTLAAIARGATYIERHITLDRAMYGSDQAASLEANGLRRLVEYGKQIEICLGDNGWTEMLPQEVENAKKLRYWEA